MAGVLILGRNGQVGRALAALEWPGLTVMAVGRPEADLISEGPARLVERQRPAVVINAAAYTDVEGAQREQALAFAVNAEGPERLARACARAGAWLVQYSTDYVFDGTKEGAYVETDAPAPLNAYGASKLAGERAVAAGAPAHLILRTGWVYSREGENFVTKVLARARAGAPLAVVADQFGAPTWAASLAVATRAAVQTVLRAGSASSGLGGLYHLAAGGRCSWHEVAVEALRISGLPQPVAPVPAATYPGVPRPRNSQLDSSRFARAFGTGIGHWREDLRRCLGGG
jgi:dTDP-4-dehydrorhamnose reductase